MSKKLTLNEKASKEFDVSSIPKPVLKEISAYAAQKGVEAFNTRLKEYKENSHDYRTNNAKLLMKKYRWLKGFTKNAVSELTQVLDEEDIVLLESMGMDNIRTAHLESTKDRITFTNIVLEHIDTMLEVYMNKCLASEKDEVRRRWRILYNVYISDEPKTVEQLAEDEYVTERTVFNDLKTATEELSGLFFGLDFSDLFTF